MDLEEEEVVPFSNEVKLINELEAEEEDDEDPGILDLSGHDLEKLSRAHKECALTTTTLLLDNNALQRLDNIHTYQCLEKLSVQNNRLARIFQVGKLCHLKILNLANNSIVAMEGFKELKLLSCLKAEWMYSQSKGRHFAVGQHKELCKYLLSICPLHPDENWEEDKKLNLILSKVQEHQESLRKDPAESLNLVIKTNILPGTTIITLYLQSSPQPKKLKGLPTNYSEFSETLST
ncbi:CEP97 [Lepeophtheirus salmonis]|uniref:CEP97 n=1 Tax=Lepeophtheirus salmonis TaxID=72036 RepID=A0A7R8D1M3_LEPSM|nr:CEP97 [Lepeophtheirus salmonis]CAF2997150.1 CEP97 [Lepeophtheirus salmonis]